MAFLDSLGFSVFFLSVFLFLSCVSFLRLVGAACFWNTRICVSTCWCYWWLLTLLVRPVTFGRWQLAPKCLRWGIRRRPRLLHFIKFSDLKLFIFSFFSPWFLTKICSVTRRFFFFFFIDENRRTWKRTCQPVVVSIRFKYLRIRGDNALTSWIKWGWGGA